MFQVSRKSEVLEKRQASARVSGLACGRFQCWARAR